MRWGRRIPCSRSRFVVPDSTLAHVSDSTIRPTPSLGDLTGLGLDEYLDEHLREFRGRFGSHGGERTFFSPGRVNMFGGHLDYNGGPVLPTAIDRGTFIAIRPRDNGRVRLASVFDDELFEGELAALPQVPRGRWFDYVVGVFRALAGVRDEFVEGGGCDVLFGGNLPVGAGLSSSASITVGTAFALDTIFALGLDPGERVAAALDAERGFVGVQCGIMDPFAVGFAKPRHVLWLDCKDESFEHLPLDFGCLSIGVVDSGVQRALARGEFNRRVEECRAAFEALRTHVPGATVMRDIPLDVVREHASELDPDIAKRALHVAAEVERTFTARRAFEEADFALLGETMAETHRSFRELYECSCAELDVLVDAALAQDGVFGARLTGAGFGGCIVMLVAAGAEERASEGVADIFEERYGRRPPAAFFQGDEGPREVAR